MGKGASAGFWIAGVGVGAEVLGVGVGGVTVPDAAGTSTADNFTFCGLPAASSVRARLPDTEIPLAVFPEVGVNVTETMHVPPLPASVVTQFWLALNPLPLVAMPLIDNATELELVKVTGIVLDVPS